MRKSTIALIIVLVVLSYVIFGSILISWLIRSQPKLPTFSKNLALIEVEGIIADPRVVVRQIKKYSKNPAVAALVLRIDSPGGVVSATQEIYEEIKRAKEREKKIIVSMGSIAASGGYYIATPADIIVANPGSVTGSIGVKMELPILERLFKKIGINFEVIKSKEHKDIGSPFRQMTPRERALLQDVVNSAYEQFISVIVENRKLPEATVRSIADGRILTGEQAIEFGLVDTLGSLEDALRIAANMVGIKGEPRVMRERKRIRITDLLFSQLARNLLIPKLKYIP